MLDPDADLRAIRTADKQVHYLTADAVEEFSRTHQVIENNAAWAGTQRGVLLARRARTGENGCRRHQQGGLRADPGDRPDG